MHADGLSYRLIDRNVGMSKNTVMNIVRRSVGRSPKVKFEVAGQGSNPTHRQGPKLRGDRFQRSGVCSAPEPTDPPMAAALRMRSRRSSRTQRGMG